MMRHRPPDVNHTSCAIHAVLADVSGVGAAASCHLLDNSPGNTWRNNLNARLHIDYLSMSLRFPPLQIADCGPQGHGQTKNHSDQRGQKTRRKNAPNLDVFAIFGATAFLNYRTHQ